MHHSDYEYRKPELMAGETIVSQIVPKKVPYMVHQFFQRIYPVVFILSMIAFFLIIPLVQAHLNGMTILMPTGFNLYFIFLFVVMSLIPMFPWIKDVLFLKRNYRNTVYYLTNKRVIIFTGNTYPDEFSIAYSDIRNVITKPFLGQTKCIYLYDVNSITNTIARFNTRNMYRKYHTTVLKCVEDADRIQSLINRYMVSEP